MKTYTHNFKAIGAGIATLALLAGISGFNLFPTSSARAAEETVCTPETVTISSDASVMANGSPAVPTYMGMRWVRIPGATWIWESDLVSDPNAEQTVNFSKEFSLDLDEIESAELKVAADTRHTLKINGIIVSEGETIQPREAITVSTDLASKLQAGSNTIEATVTNTFNAEDEAEDSPHSNPAGLAFILTVNGQNCETVTVEDPTASLSVSVDVINDDNGTSTAADATVTLTGPDGNPESFTATDETRTFTVAPGEYSVSASAMAGYSLSLADACSGTLAADESADCVITYDDDEPADEGSNELATVNVSVDMINDNGGTNVAGDVQISVDAEDADPASFSGSEDPVAVTFTPGVFSVTAASLANYSISRSDACEGQITGGEVVDCTITVNDNAPAGGGTGDSGTATINVDVNIVNDNNGTNEESDLQISIAAEDADPASFAGSDDITSVTVAPGDYSVTAASLAGYNIDLSDSCDGTIAENETVTCTITADDVVPGINIGNQNPTPNNPAPVVQTNTGGEVLGAQTDGVGVIIVVNHVINDDGGSKVAGDFLMTVSGNNPSVTSFAGSEGGTAISVDAGSYAINQVIDPDYLTTRAFECDGTIAEGETKLCIITNDDIASGEVLGADTDLPYMPQTGSDAAPRNYLLAVMGLAIIASAFMLRRAYA